MRERERAAKQARKEEEEAEAERLIRDLPMFRLGTKVVISSTESSAGAPHRVRATAHVLCRFARTMQKTTIPDPRASLDPARTAPRRRCTSPKSHARALLPPVNQEAQRRANHHERSSSASRQKNKSPRRKRRWCRWTKDRRRPRRRAKRGRRAWPSCGRARATTRPWNCRLCLRAFVVPRICSSRPS